MSTRTKILAGVAVLAVLVIVLARGEEPSAQLQALEDDPMAAYVPPGGTLVDTDSQNEGTALGKPVSASYTRMFELGAGAAARAVEHARAAATKPRSPDFSVTVHPAATAASRACSSAPAAAAAVSSNMRVY